MAPVTRFAPRLTSRLCLRDFTAADVARFAGYRAEPEVARYQSWSDFALEDAEAFLRQQSTAEFGRSGTWYQVAIADRASDVLLGDLALHFLASDARQFELGFTLSPAAQGRGIASEAVRSILDLLFAERGMHRAIAVVDARNAAAAQLLRAVGFRQEAHHRQNIFFKGAWGDEWVFAMLAEEWASQQTG